LPNNVRCLNEFLFERCESLTEVYLGKHIKDVKPWAFEDCTSLKHIYVPQGQVERIKDMLPEDLRVLVVEHSEEVVEQLEEVSEPPMFLN
jgi:hypothetical protein